MESKLVARIGILERISSGFAPGNRAIAQAAPFPIGRGTVGEGLAARWPLPECVSWV